MGSSDGRFRKMLGDPNALVVKVCGITTIEDALASVELGANALGFNFFPPSPRYVDPLRAEEIIGQLPPGILSVGVIVAGPKAVTNVTSEAPARGTVQIQVPGSGTKITLRLPRNLDLLQVHGAGTKADLDGLEHELLVAVSPENAGDFDDYPIIVDTSWGTGRLADWEAIRKLNQPYILSGGLDPGNIGEALKKLKPAGIDVCSGVESRPGRKDPEKLRAFLEQINRASGVGRRKGETLER